MFREEKEFFFLLFLYFFSEKGSVLFLWCYTYYCLKNDPF